MAKLRSPIKIIGGKGVLRGRILPYFPAHKTYVEPFAGGANLLLAKEPCKVEVLNDLDPRVVALFEVISDPELLPVLTERLMLTPYSREERLYAKARWKDFLDDPVELARMFFVDCRQSLGGMIDRTSWGFVKSGPNASVKGLAQPISAYIKAIRTLPKVGDRLSGVKIHNADYKDILVEYDAEDTLFYLDPPYPKDTRRDGWYNFEMSNSDHAELVERVVGLRGSAILSGYPNDIYQKLEIAGWQRVEFDRSCNAAARTSHTQLQGDGIIKVLQGRVECLWINPRAQQQN
jgi:DNA adenine methylase